MTSHLFSSFRDASLFAKQMALERKGKVSLVRSTEGFIVECAFHVDAQVRKYAEKSLEYDEWVKEQGIEKSGAAEGQWFEAYKAGTELQNYSTKDSAAERLAEVISAPYLEQQKKNDELTEQITERDIKEFREKLGRLIAEEDKKRKEKLLSDQKALENRERKKAKKIKERDERLEADRIEREKYVGCDEPTQATNEKAGTEKITGTVLPDQDSRRGTTICPRCGGDGGVNGGCAKCDGTGWVNSLDK